MKYIPFYFLIPAINNNNMVDTGTCEMETCINAADVEVLI
jgi:hypothetical protein